MYWFVGYRVLAGHRRADPARDRSGGGDMTVILLRHGRSTSNTAHTLAGRSEGVDLDDKGREQAEALVDRHRKAADPRDRPLAAAALRTHGRAAGRGAGSGARRRRADLRGRLRRRGPAARSATWSRSRCGRWCSSSPARRCFPTGRAWPRFRRARWPRSASTTAGWPSEHGGDVLWVACTHGDVIKAVWPTRSAPIWTASSASPPTPHR